MNKINAVILLILIFFISLFCYLFFCKPYESLVADIISPAEIILADKKVYKPADSDCFDADYTSKNLILAEKLGISEDEAFIIGSLGKYWAKNILQNKPVKVVGDDLVYYRFGKALNGAAFNRILDSVRRGKYVIVDLDNDSVLPVSKSNRQKVTNFLVVKRNHVKNIKKDKIYNTVDNYGEFVVPKIPQIASYKADFGNVKIILSDSTTKIYPDRNCSSEICKEILDGIKTAESSIDIAIYGYSSIPAIEKAIVNAIQRGVKIRLVYDVDVNGNNIYPDTDKFVKLISGRVNDGKSQYAASTMHNKFYIFDNKYVITGSANLSHTDMSGFNSNAIIVIKFPQVASFYKQEFEQMFEGKFHNDKVSHVNKKFENISVYFSPQDKSVKNGVLPLIQSAKKYIYIPTFVITEKRVVEALINAKNRGVDVKIIADALNASNVHSKHKELRNAGIPVKTENFAGKMHSKSIIIDDEYVVIGSMNFSNSGENKNDENLVVLKNSDAAKFYRDFFLYQWGRIPDKWLKLNARAEGEDSVGSCSDGLDNNYDGKTDLQDEACKKK